MNLRGEFVLLFRFFAGGNGFAEAAWMIAIKRSCHGIIEGTRLKIICEHRRPRDRLEKCPMPAEHCHQRQSDKNFAGTDKHDGTFRCQTPKVKVDYTILGNLPTTNGK